MNRAEETEAKLREWREDPVLFVQECFGVEPDAWQADVLRAFPINQRLAMKACKGPGKTCLIAWLCWNFLLTRPSPKVVATSISADNLADGLWAEMAKWQHKSRNGLLEEMFQWNKTRISLKSAPENWFMSARAWSKSATSDQQANTLAGLHADYILFVLDESGGIPDAVMAAAEAALSTGIECKLVQAGNPTHTEGPLYRSCTSEAHLWHVTEITGDPDDPKRSPRIDVKWARAQIDKYGRDNPWVLVNVFGKFPPGSLNTLLGVEEVRAAINRGLQGDQFQYAQKRLGVDVARFGDDRTVLIPRQGLQCYKPVVMRNARSQDIASRIAAAKMKWDSEVEFIDGTGGYGAGVIDFLISTGQTPLEINFAGKADDPRYLNKRAEMWFRMAEWVKRGGSLPNDPDLVKELTAPTYSFSNNGKFVLEKKDQIKERLGFSPDLADALALTFATEEQPKRKVAERYNRKGKAKIDYDIFDSH